MNQLVIISHLTLLRGLNVHLFHFYFYQRLTLKSWFTNLEQTPLNRSQQLPAPYKRLIDEIKQN